jgi:uncharacterized protein YjbI with pentapeptide repeats
MSGLTFSLSDKSLSAKTDFCTMGSSRSIFADASGDIADDFEVQARVINSKGPHLETVQSALHQADNKYGPRMHELISILNEPEVRKYDDYFEAIEKLISKLALLASNETIQKADNGKKIFSSSTLDAENEFEIFEGESIENNAASTVVGQSFIADLFDELGVTFEESRVDRFFGSGKSFNGMTFKNSEINFSWELGSSFVASDFSGATLRGSFETYETPMYLNGAKFLNSDLRDLKIDGDLIFDGADFTGCSFGDINLSYVKFDADTILKDIGFYGRVRFDGKDLETNHDIATALVQRGADPNNISFKKKSYSDT